MHFSHGALRVNPYCPENVVCCCLHSNALQTGFSLIFSCIRRLQLFLGVQNFEFQYFSGVFRKLNIFGGMKILWIFFGVITKLDYTLHFRVFSEGQGTKWRIFFGLLKFQIFIWGA